MNGYYRRRSSLPYEEIRPLEFNELEFVSDVGEPCCGEDGEYPCPVCHAEIINTEDESDCSEYCD